MRLIDLLNARLLQDIQDDFHALTGLTLHVHDSDGDRVTEENGLPDFCKIVRSTPKGMKICKSVAAERTIRNKVEIQSGICAAGLKHIEVPIIMDNEIMGYIVMGSISPDRPLSQDFIDNLAEEIGVDAPALNKAASRLVPLPGNKLDSATNLLITNRSYLIEQAGMTKKYEASNRALEMRERDALILSKAGSIFSSSLDTEEIFRGLAKLTSEEIGETCTIFKVEGVHLLPITTYRNGEEDKKRFKTLIDNPVPLQGSLTGFSVINKESIFIPDTSQDQRFMSFYREHINVRSYICVPLIARDEVLGVLATSIINSSDRKFSENDLSLAVSVADRTAAAIENSVLYEKARERAQLLSVVNEISRAVNSSLDIETVYDAIVEQLRKNLPFAFNMNIALHQPEDDTFTFSHIYGSEHQSILETDQPYPSDLLMLTKAFKDKKPYYVRDATRETPPEKQLRRQAAEKGMLSSLYLPLIVEQECTGTLNIETFQTEAFSDEEIALLETISSHLAIAIKNARIYEGLQKANREMAFMNSIMDLLNRPFDITQVSEKALDRALDFVGLTTGGIYLLDDAGQNLHSFVHTDMPEEYLENISVLSVEDSLSGHVAKTGQSLYGGDFSNHPMMKVPAVKDEGFKGFVIVPIRSQEEILGSLPMVTREEKSISKDDVRLLEALGAQIGVALKSSTLQQQLIQAEKISATGELISGVAHELNNPLSVILGRTQMLLLAGDEEKREDYEAIIKSVDRCRTITNNLLSFTREVVPEKKLISINDCIEQVLSIISYHLTADNISVWFDLDSELPQTMVDENQMEQVFLNVISNAQQAILEKKTPGNIVITSNRIGDDIVVSFKDNGIGMDKSVLNRVFDPFFSTKDVGEGTGLGLSVSLGIIRNHRGNIKISSEPDKGSEVAISLPITKPLVAEEEPGFSGGRYTLPAQKRALIVEDEKDILTFYSKLFARYDWEAVMVTDGNEALDYISNGDEFDIILCDLKMPGMSGRELYETLKAEYPSRLEKFIISTGDVINKDTQQFLEETKVAYVKKPVDLPELIRTVSKVLTDN